MQVGGDLGRAHDKTLFARPTNWWRCQSSSSWRPWSFLSQPTFTRILQSSSTKFGTNCGASLTDGDACHHHHGDRDHFNRMRPNNNEYDVRFSNILTVWLRKSYVLSFCPKSSKLRTGKCDSRYFLYLLCVSSIEFGNVVTWHYFGNLFFTSLQNFRYQVFSTCHFSSTATEVLADIHFSGVWWSIKSEYQFHKMTIDDLTVVDIIN